MMTREGRRGFALIGIAIVLGVLADVLFVGRALGLNVLLFTACFVAALALLLRIGGGQLHQGRRWMAAPLLLFGAAFLWRDSPLLAATNLLALAGAVSLGALRRAQPRPQDARIVDYAAALAAAGAGTFAGAIDLLESDVPWAAAKVPFRSKTVGAVGRGLAMGLPFVLLFGGLFVAADAVFKRIVTGVIPTTIANPWPDAVVALVAGWLCAGLLRDLVEDREERRLVSLDALKQREVSVRIGATEVAVVLAALDVLFLAFVIVQARYLFGGTALVESRAHLTYAQYARHGFFELVAVSLLVVPVILTANTVTGGRRRLVRGLSAGLVLLEIVVALSALQRLRVYVHEYGLTELRIYATGVVLWIMAVLLWALATVIRGRGRRFAVGVVVAGFVASAAVNVANPDALIARTQLARPGVDVGYVSRLSDDAVPVLVRRLSHVADPRLRARLAQALLARRIDGDPMAWNVSRIHARALLAQHRAELETYAGR